jgi:hypothetical protein
MYIAGLLYTQFARRVRAKEVQRIVSSVSLKDVLCICRDTQLRTS